MSAARRIDVATIAAQRWKNGAGLTREIALGPDGAGLHDFDWRLSLAEVERAAPFSVFAGIDRCIVVLRGARMTLHDMTGACVRSLEPLQPWHFDGEIALQARLDQGPCQDFNVMTRRGAWRSETVVLRQAARAECGDVTLLLVASGQWRIGEDSFAPLQALLLEGAGAPVDVAPLVEGAALLCARLCQDPRP